MYIMFVFIIHQLVSSTYYKHELQQQSLQDINIYITLAQQILYGQTISPVLYQWIHHHLGLLVGYVYVSNILHSAYGWRNCINSILQWSLVVYIIISYCFKCNITSV